MSARNAVNDTTTADLAAPETSETDSMDIEEDESNGL
jgi:hypothetical protein